MRVYVNRGEEYVCMCVCENGVHVRCERVWVRTYSRLDMCRGFVDV